MTQNEVLVKILEYVAPYVAGMDVAGPPAIMTGVRVYCSPLRVEIARHEQSGQVVMFRPPLLDPALGEFVADFLNRGLARLPEAAQASVGTFLREKLGEVVVLVDVDAETVAGVMQPVNDAAEPVVLFALHWPLIPGRLH